MATVDFQNVRKQYTLKIDRETQTVEALKGASFSVGDGQIATLIGPSGCGKTTALRIAMGLEKPSSGAVLIDGKPVEGCGYDRGLVFQHAELLPWLSALQNVMFGLEMKGVRGSELKDRAMQMLELVGLAHCASRRPHQLSGGMKQRVGIARALAIDPKVLLMDEPFGALDAQTREELQGELLDIQHRTGKTIVIVTHDLDEAVLLADRIVIMLDGKAQEIIDVPASRPRDLEAMRASQQFAETRLHIWHAIRSPGRSGATTVRETA